MAIKIVHGGGSFPQPPSPKLFRNIAVTFVLITIAVIGIALWTSSVRATITVKVKKEPVSVDTVVDISPSPTSDQIKGRVVSGAFTESKEFPGTAVSSTPVNVAPPAPAKTAGRVKIINNYSKSQPLVATTRLLTEDGRLYRLTKGVTVAAGGTAEVEAASDEVGSKFALPAGTKLTIPGLWSEMQKHIYAETVTAFDLQGQDSSTPNGPHKIVTADAQAKAYDELYAAALDKAKQSLNIEAGVPAGWEAVYLINNSQKQSNAAPGQEKDTFLSQVKLTITAVFFPKEDILALLRTRLNEKLPQGYSLVDVDLSKANFHLESVDTSKNTARLSLSAEAQSQLVADTPVFKKDLIVGLPSDEVIRKWSALDGVDSVDVELQPSWVHRLPSMKDKITVIVN